MTAFPISLLLGIDERTAFSLRKGGDGYPPYDVERLPGTTDAEEILRITLAVAGFRAEDLDVTTADNQLVIRGRQADEGARTYLHRGIAARRFQKSFLLAKGMKVLTADLRNGMLCIDLSRPTGERGVRSVSIGGPTSGSSD